MRPAAVYRNAIRGDQNAGLSNGVITIRSVAPETGFVPVSLPQAREPAVRTGMMELLRLSSSGLRVDYATTAAGRAVVEFLDEKGRVLYRLAENHPRPGRQRAFWNCGAVARGVCIVRVTTDSWIRSAITVNVR